MNDRAAELPQRVQRLIAHLFDPADHADATELVMEILSGPPSAPPYDERCQIAALRWSRGEPERLLDAVALFQTDWRDLLVVAGFGHDIHAHETWWPDDRR